MKKLVVWFLVAIIFGSFSGCKKSSSDNDASAPRKSGRPTIFWVNPIVGHPVYVMQDEGFLMAAEDYGFEPVIVGPVNMDPEAYIIEIENGIVQKVDGIVCVPAIWSSIEPVLRRAKAAGIPVVCAGASTPEDWRLSFIGTDNQAYGIQAAKLIAEKKQGKAKICIMMSKLDVQNQVETKQAFEEYLKNYPEMEVVVVESDRADLSMAMQKFENIFRAYPQVDTVIMLEATGAVAAARVAQEMGIIEKMTILAVDDIKETVDCIKKGTIWATMAQNFYRMGYESAAMIMEHRQGKKVPVNVDSGVTIVTKDNVDSYKQEMLDAIRRKNTKSPETQAEKNE